MSDLGMWIESTARTNPTYGNLFGGNPYNTDGSGSGYNVSDPWNKGGYVLPTNNAKAAEALRADMRAYDMQVQSQWFNSAEAAKARNWEKMMSDTAFQRKVADLQAAGFSPLAALGGASGASTPSAAVAHSGSSGSHAANLGAGALPIIGKIIGAIITKGMSSAMVAQEMQSKAQTAMDIANEKIKSSEKIAQARLDQRAHEFDENTDWRLTKEKIRQVEANSAEKLAREKFEFDKRKFYAGEDTTVYDGKGRKVGSKTKFKYD